MLQIINCFLSYVIDLILLINLIVLFILFSRLRWISALLFAIVFYITFALFLINIGVDFIGMLYFIVYLGAIMTLFLFAVMFLHTRTSFKLYTKNIMSVISEFSNIWTQAYFIYNLLKLYVMLSLTIFHLKRVKLLNDFQSWSYTFPFLYQSSKQYTTLCNSYKNRYLSLQKSISLVLAQLEATFVSGNSFSNLILKIGRVLFYSVVFLGFVFITSIIDVNTAIFGFYSEEAFSYLGSVLELLRRSLFFGLQLEFILVGLIFWVAFICVLSLLYKRK